MTTDEQELLDYDETDEQSTTGNHASATGTGNNGTIATSKIQNGSDGSLQPKIGRGTYVSIHASGFKDFLLKPELLRAIMDCGFEHPSE
ncbi:unnamed protein product, partial [Didymodactylos carnosus]